ncbi:hypothetical protein BBJ28_00018209 [Nothophytophthora sp. Chile5]|nr:hypothetical protein BBJ28_00018209 [Nothophytophthora sp. Chile5]
MSALATTQDQLALLIGAKCTPPARMDTKQEPTNVTAAQGESSAATVTTMDVDDVKLEVSTASAVASASNGASNALSQPQIETQEQVEAKPEVPSTGMDVEPAATTRSAPPSRDAMETPAEAAEPLSDLAVAAQYAESEIQSVAAQFANTTMESGPTASASISNEAIDAMDEDSGKTESKDGTEQDKPSTGGAGASSDSEDSSDEDEEDRDKLRADIEAAMEKEDAKSAGPLKTVNEVSALPVREPNVELTADCPIAHCGSILNASVPGLMLTIKSNPNTQPLDEGSVLCLEDRTVLGCVDEVFGPVLMPMYVVRFESAAKMPEKALANAAVFYATEHTTYIVPEEIKDKGTDASNIFDEETDETVFSDDEAEAAAKRGNRKRNRGGAHASPAGSEANSNYAPSSGGRGGRGGRGSRGTFTDYNARQSGASHGRGSYGQQPMMQMQAHGGVTNYTQPRAGGGFAPPRPPVAYGSTNYTSPQGYGAPQPPLPPYNSMGIPQPPPGQYYQPPTQYHAHNLPPYPPQALPPQQSHPTYQQYPQPPGSAYPQPPPPPYNQGHHGVAPPPRADGYYGANGQQQPPLPPGPYDQRRYQ